MSPVQHKQNLTWTLTLLYSSSLFFGWTFQLERDNKQFIVSEWVNKCVSKYRKWMHVWVGDRMT